jgi:hypothetical protein
MKAVLMVLVFEFAACGRAEEGKPETAPAVTPTPVTAPAVEVPVEDPEWTGDRLAHLSAGCEAQVRAQVDFWVETPPADFPGRYCACIHMELKHLVTFAGYLEEPLRWHGELAKRGFQESCRDTAFRP